MLTELMSHGGLGGGGGGYCGAKAVGLIPPNANKTNPIVNAAAFPYVRTSIRSFL